MCTTFHVSFISFLLPDIIFEILFDEAVAVADAVGLEELLWVPRISWRISHHVIRPRAHDGFDVTGGCDVFGRQVVVIDGGRPRPRGATRCASNRVL